MLKYIVAVSFAAALVLGVHVSPVLAQVNCTTFGNMTTCNGPGGSVNCTRFGNMTTCN